MKDDEMVARQVLRLARKLTARRNQHLRALMLTSEQANALQFFADTPNQTITAFKTVQAITHQTARLIVQRLVKRGLLAFVSDPDDGRVKRVVVTAAGRAKREQLRRHGWQTSAAMFNGFTPAEQRNFLTLLQRAQENIEREV